MEFFLLWGKTLAHAFILFFGLVFVSRKIFFLAWMNYLLAVFVSRLLKVWFAVPLIYGASEDKFGLPSGHVYVSISIYLWIFLTYRSPIIRSLLGGICLGLGVAIVHFGYHTWMDVGAAWFLAGLQTVGVFWGVKNKDFLQQDPRWICRVLVIFAGVALFYLSYKVYLHQGTLDAFYTLIGVWIASELVPQWLKTNQINQKKFLGVFSLSLLGLCVFIYFTRIIMTNLVHENPVLLGYKPHIFSIVQYSLFSFLLVVVLFGSRRMKQVSSKKSL